MTEINVQDITVLKNGVWQSLMTGKVYKNGIWRDFQGISKAGNWYSVLNEFYITNLYSYNLNVYLSKSEKVFTPENLSWSIPAGQTVKIIFGSKISDGSYVQSGDYIYVYTNINWGIELFTEGEIRRGDSIIIE